jgi:hypothetical protein
MKKTSLKYFLMFLPGLFLLTGTLVAQPNFPEPAGEDEPGFVKIFDGKTLDGWEGDLNYWSVVDGTITGEITPENALEHNTFLIWQEGLTGDFELKLEYRISEKGNSGIQYRSAEVPGEKYSLKGYQFDIDGQGRHTGQNYDELGRRFLALRGQVTKATGGEKAMVIGTVGDMEELFGYIHKEDWNACHIIARGNILTHMINGHVMCMVVDNDEKERDMEGLLGVQVHVGPPMKVEFRNLRIKQY